MSLTLSPTSAVRLDRSSDARLTTGLRSAVMLALTVLAVNFFAPTSRGQEIPAGAQDAEVLTRGPVHDAFAMPVGLDPVPGIVVPNQPPADIEELPPEVAVEDPNAEWIAGYWNWDEERNDFIWISGVWRVAPPDHRWVAGYWTEVQGGFQRISGFWAPIEVRQVAYYPQPPQSLEAGPNSPQPSPNYFWVPGNWVYTDGRYLWRGGYWAVSQENWVWMPAYYVRTPGGYIYNAGYWDYPLDNRGMMFAPVYINRTVYMRPNYYYSPSVVIRAASLLVHLFARPAYGSYYFGDYYGPTYATAGYQPWFNAGGGPRGGVRWYDPIYTYQRSRHRGDPNWSRHLHERYDFYASNQDARPRRTFEEQRRFASVQGPNRDRDEFRNAILATSVADVINNVSNTTIVNNTIVNKNIDNDVIKNITNVNIRRVQNDERKTIQKQALEVKQFAKQRSEVERQGRVVAAGNVGGPNGRGPNADPNRGPRPGAEPVPGANVAAGVQAPALTLPELPVGERGNRGRGPGNTAGPNNTTRPGNAGPGNVAGPTDRPNREGRPERPDANRPQRPDPQRPGNVAGSTPGLPNGVNPDADRPQTGRPADMPGRRTGSAIPGSDVPENPAAPSATRPNIRPRPTGVNPMPSGTPGIPRLPGIGEQPRDPRGPNPRNPERPGNPGLPGNPALPGNPNWPGGVDPSQPVPLPRPTLPNPTATSPKPRLPDQPRSVEQPRNRELPGNPNRPNIGDQPRNVPPRTELPRGVPGLGEQPRPGNGPGRGNRPEGGRPDGGRPEGIQPRVNVPGVGGPNVNRENPMPRPEARPQQRERPQGGPQAKPDRGPKVKAPDAPQTPPGAKPDGTKPEKKKKD